MAAMAPAPAHEARGGAAWQRAGRRLFRYADGDWVDVGVEEGSPELAIEPYAAAWFDLLQRFPALRSAASLGESVIIAGDGLTLKLVEGGREQLDADAWQRLERAFAGER